MKNDKIRRFELATGQCYEASMEEDREDGTFMLASDVIPVIESKNEIIDKFIYFMCNMCNKYDKNARKCVLEKHFKEDCTYGERCWRLVQLAMKEIE